TVATARLTIIGCPPAARTPTCARVTARAHHPVLEPGRAPGGSLRRFSGVPWANCQLSREGTMSTRAQDGLLWRKSTASWPAGCVEVAATGERIYVRDSKEVPVGPTLSFTPREWTD